jgi:hypothetical protein
MERQKPSDLGLDEAHRLACSDVLESLSKESKDVNDKTSSWFSDMEMDMLEDNKISNEEFKVILSGLMLGLGNGDMTTFNLDLREAIVIISENI